MCCNICVTGETLLGKVRNSNTELVKWSSAPAGLSEVRWTRTTIGGPNDLEGSVTPVRFAPPPPSDHPTPSTLPLSLARGPALTAFVRTVPPPHGPPGPIRPRHRARLGQNPPGLVNQNSFPFFLFSFFFSYLYIYIYILIFYAPKIV
jgi:hypothetical protein